MGVWGTQNFENDFAFMWLDEFLKEPSYEKLMRTFEAVTKVEILMDDDTPFLDSDESFHALAAAEVVARLLDRPSEDFPEDDFEPEHLQIQVDTKLLSAAKAAVSRIIHMEGHSELKELWLESDDYQEWEKVVKGLITRLSFYIAR
jgi:hypothetical protein